MKTIQQDDDYGCAIACLAMAMGCGYAKARREVETYFETFQPFDKYTGLGDDQDRIILYKNGYRLFPIRKPEGLRGAAFKKFVGKQHAILTLPSINVQGLFHGVYWDGKKIHDPSRGKRNTTKSAWKNVISARIITRAVKRHDLNGINGYVGFVQTKNGIWVKATAKEGKK